MNDTPQYDGPQYDGRDLLRLTTAGSVDDGKSTLIGRLLADTGALSADQLSTLAAQAVQSGSGTDRPRADHRRLERRT